ncbi:MAG TPA: hypothetical protein VHY56_09695, partial [Candidatus Binataceae bacterium]|nr:hypothetical protein [Candidatus Binataceae bacterium]
MLLTSVVETSNAISATTKRLQKTDLLATLLRRLSPEEVEIVVAWLSGATRQGAIGVGYATLRAASAPPSASPTLEILTVDLTFSELAVVKGSGSEQRRRELLHSLFGRATEIEQRFIVGVLGGELRQGALQGIMLEAIAKAAGIDVEHVRRASMMAGSIQAIARPSLERGEAGSAEFDIRLFRPVQPMLAQSAEDVATALKDLGEASIEYKFDGAR